jgi:hypothetical protein
MSFMVFVLSFKNPIIIDLYGFLAGESLVGGLALRVPSTGVAGH